MNHPILRFLIILFLFISNFNPKIIYRFKKKVRLYGIVYKPWSKTKTIPGFHVLVSFSTNGVSEEIVYISQCYSFNELINLQTLVLHAPTRPVAALSFDRPFSLYTIVFYFFFQLRVSAKIVYTIQCYSFNEIFNLLTLVLYHAANSSFILPYTL